MSKSFRLITVNRNKMVRLAGKLQRGRQIMLRIKEKKMSRDEIGARCESVLYKIISGVSGY